MTTEQQRRLTEARDTVEAVQQELEEAQNTLYDTSGETTEYEETKEQARFCNEALFSLEAALGY